MPLVHYHDLGKIGEITDIPGHELPPDALWVTYNLRTSNKYLEGLGSELAQGDTLSAVSQQIAFVEYPTKEYWAVFNPTDISIWDPEVDNHYNISKLATPGTSYTGTWEDRWNSCWLNGIWIANNGVDTPQYWSNGDTATRLQNIPAWPTGWQAKVVRSYKNFLIAMNITKSGTNYPALISWSHPADPGSPPSSWDITDPTKLAGDKQLSSTEGAVVEGLALREAFVLYKKDAIVLMQYVGGNDIFSFRDISDATGILGQNCVVEFKPGYHLFLSSDGDVMVNNGQTIESVATGRVLDSIRLSIADEYPSLVVRREKKEVWILLTEQGDDGSSVRIYSWQIWNWETGAWTTSGQLASYRDIRSGSMAYGASASQMINEVVMGLSSDGQQLYQIDTPYGMPGAVGDYAYMFSGFLSFDRKVDQAGQPRVDYNRHKVLTEIWPNMSATGCTVDLYVYASRRKEDIYGAENNYQVFTFDPSTDSKIDCLIEGKYFRFEWIFFPSGDEQFFQFYGFSLNYEEGGVYL